MRRRAKRDLITLVGVVFIALGIVVANAYMRLDTLKEAAIKLRKQYEAKYQAEGVTLIEWDDMQKTKGSLKTGARFSEGILQLDNGLVNIVGFMSPIDQFSNVSEFMLLPMPTSCYFCESPPPRDIIEVKLEKPSKMVDEPVLIGGRFHLHKEPEPMFFTSIAEAKWNEAVDATRKVVEEDHRDHLRSGWDKIKNKEQEEELLEPNPLNYQPASVEDQMKQMGVSTSGTTHEGLPIIGDEKLLPAQPVPSTETTSD